MVEGIGIEPSNRIFHPSQKGSFSRPKVFLKKERKCTRAQLLSCVPVFATPWSLQLCNPPGSSVHGISQAGILQWVASLWEMGYPF